jgi:hypothetical protein
LVADERPGGPQIFGGLVNIQTINAGGTFVGPYPFPCPLQVLSRQDRQKQT